MSFLFFIFIFILFIGIFIVVAVLGFLRSIFTFGKGKNPSGTPSQDFEQPAGKSKIFDKKEGEYVDFEEIEEKES
ncbi:MAG: DUF4834 family protein [Paludibacter sp.]|nr:DUF4834 family protein [Paludibacter sp.]